MKKIAFKLLRDMERSWWYEGRTSVVRAVLNQTMQNKLQKGLDFGAGYGGMYELLSEYCENVYGFEPDVGARVKAAERGYVSTYSTQEDILANSYDLVGLFDVVEHIEDDMHFISTQRDLLTDNGLLVITVPAFQFLWSKHDVEHHHFRRYSRKSLRKLLEDNGFKVERISYWNMSLFLPAASVRLLGLSGKGSLSLPPLLDKILYGLVMIEVQFMRFISLPFGTGIVAVAREK